MKNQDMKVLFEGWRRFINEVEEPKKNISYTGVVLYDDSYEALKALIPEKWEVVCHHMTLHMGPIKSEEEKALVGKEYVLNVEGFAKDDKVCAVKVAMPEELSAYYKGEGVPHITVAVNREAGGKPFLSNKLNWSQLEESSVKQVSGKLLEVTQGDNSLAKRD